MKRIGPSIDRVVPKMARGDLGPLSMIKHSNSNVIVFAYCMCTLESSLSTCPANRWPSGPEHLMCLGKCSTHYTIQTREAECHRIKREKEIEQAFRGGGIRGGLIRRTACAILVKRCRVGTKESRTTNERDAPRERERRTSQRQGK